MVTSNHRVLVSTYCKVIKRGNNENLSCLFYSTKKKKKILPTLKKRFAVINAWEIQDYIHADEKERDARIILFLH